VSEAPGRSVATYETLRARTGFNNRDIAAGLSELVDHAWIERRRTLFGSVIRWTDWAIEQQRARAANSASENAGSSTRPHQKASSSHTNRPGHASLVVAVRDAAELVAIHSTLDAYAAAYEARFRTPYVGAGPSLEAARKVREAAACLGERTGAEMPIVLRELAAAFLDLERGRGTELEQQHYPISWWVPRLGQCAPAALAALARRARAEAAARAAPTLLDAAPPPSSRTATIAARSIIAALGARGAA
jgi:hypothetical protein